MTRSNEVFRKGVSGVSTGTDRGKPSLARRCVLVVDDERDFASTVKDLLEEEGYGVVTAETGEAALAHLTALTPDVILLDLTMPGELDGWRLQQLIQESERLAEVPLIIMSGAAHPRGAAARPVWLDKPVGCAELLRAIRAHLAS